jgi:diguanylate cyclase
MKKPNSLWIITAAIIVINFIVYLFKPGGDIFLRYVSDLLPVLCSFITIICLLLAIKGFRKFDYTKLSWISILIGIILFFLAESAYAILEIYAKRDMGKNFPSYADFFWCAAYIPFFIGLTMMFIGYKKSGLPMGQPALYLAVGFTIFLIALIVVFFLLIPVITDPETSQIDKVFYLFYPIADLLIVLPAAILIYITSLFGSAVITKPWKFLTLGFILFTISDLLYSYLDWMGLYGNGNLIDLGWNAGYLLVGIAGLYQYQMVKSLNS